VRVLAIDYGERRIGLAVSDETGAFAFPAGVLERRGVKRDLAALRALARKRGVASVVVGLPLHLDGREGPEARAARASGPSRPSRCSGSPTTTLATPRSRASARSAARSRFKPRRSSAPAGNAKAPASSETASPSLRSPESIARTRTAGD